MAPNVNILDSLCRFIIAIANRFNLNARFVAFFYLFFFFDLRLVLNRIKLG